MHLRGKTCFLCYSKNNWKSIYPLRNQEKYPVTWNMKYHWQLPKSTPNMQNALQDDDTREQLPHPDDVAIHRSHRTRDLPKSNEFSSTLTSWNPKQT